jgi:hypothetical protein
MKKVILLVLLSLGLFSSLSFADNSGGGIAIPEILMFEKNQETLTRRCVNDNGCRPGVEICVGGYCVPDRGAPPFCRVDRECAPRRCVNGRCQY